MNKSYDVQQFSIQGETRDRTKFLPCTIPWWLAELAYKEYARQQGRDQSISQIDRRGGFGRAELVASIRGEYTSPGIAKAQAELSELAVRTTDVVELFAIQNDESIAKIRDQLEQSGIKVAIHLCPPSTADWAEFPFIRDLSGVSHYGWESVNAFIRRITS